MKKVLLKVLILSLLFAEPQVSAARLEVKSKSATKARESALSEANMLAMAETLAKAKI